MGVGLYLTGTYSQSASPPSAEDWFPKVQSWIEQYGSEAFESAKSGKNFK
jgi:hypothetical protein